MTYCYSSRRYGFAQQLRKDWLNELSRFVRDPNHPLQEHPFGKDHGFMVATFLGGIHEEAIEKIITSARDGMNYLCDLSRALGKHETHLSFENPIGFPMYQHYSEQRKSKQRLPFFDRDVPALDTKNNEVSYDVDTHVVDRDSSVDACSPNVIHSMDSCHLMKTALRCNERGVPDLMLVHDSFATTVGNLDKMGAIIKYELAELYKGYSLYGDIFEQNLSKVHKQENILVWAENQKDDEYSKQKPDRVLLSADDKRRNKMTGLIMGLHGRLPNTNEMDESEVSEDPLWKVMFQIQAWLKEVGIDPETFEGGEVSATLLQEIAQLCVDESIFPDVPDFGIDGVEMDINVVKKSDNSFR
jgi:DNA-directed RNA polymerase